MAWFNNDKSMSRLFKVDASGRTIAYPWGSFSSGYIVESDKQKHEIESALKKLSNFMIVFVVVGILVLRALFRFYPTDYLFLGCVFTAWIAAIIACYYFTFQKVFKSLPKNRDKLSYREYQNETLNSFSVLSLVGYLLGSLVFVTMGFFIYSKNVFAAILAIGFFGLCSLVFIYFLVKKLTLKNTDRSKSVIR
jgi:hypothetical protein